MQFFGLFGNFRGYVEYFLLQDLVTEDRSVVRFFTPFANFTTSPVPEGVEAYRHTASAQPVLLRHATAVSCSPADSVEARKGRVKCSGRSS